MFKRLLHQLTAPLHQYTLMVPGRLLFCLFVALLYGAGGAVQWVTAGTACGVAVVAAVAGLCNKQGSAERAAAGLHFSFYLPLAAIGGLTPNTIGMIATAVYGFVWFTLECAILWVQARRVPSAVPQSAPLAPASNVVDVPVNDISPAAYLMLWQILRPPEPPTLSGSESSERRTPTLPALHAAADAADWFAQKASALHFFIAAAAESSTVDPAMAEAFNAQWEELYQNCAGNGPRLGAINEVARFLDGQAHMAAIRRAQLIMLRVTLTAIAIRPDVQTISNLPRERFAELAKAYVEHWKHATPISSSDPAAINTEFRKAVKEWTAMGAPAAGPPATPTGASGPPATRPTSGNGSGHGQCVTLDQMAALVEEDRAVPPGDTGRKRQNSQSRRSPSTMAELQIFISWSHASSRKAAEAFRDWLPKALPGVAPWMSSEDITKGRPWFAVVSEQLTRSKVCLICVTPENVKSPWLFYEAGAVAHAMPGALICTYLIGVEPSALTGTPLAQFQATKFDKEDTRRLLRDINGVLATPHDEVLLRSAFDKNWTSLQKKLNKVLTSVGTPSEPDESHEPDLSNAAKHLLTEASKDERGTLSMTKNTHGFDLTAHGMQLVDGNDPRIEAVYREAVNDLVSRRLLEPRGDTGEAFALTSSGWAMADALTGR